MVAVELQQQRRGHVVLELAQVVESVLALGVKLLGLGQKGSTSLDDLVIDLALHRSDLWSIGLLDRGRLALDKLAAGMPMGGFTCHLP